MPPTQHNNVWSRTTAEGGTSDLTLPSTQTCTAVRIGLGGMARAGLLGESDSLTDLVDRKHIRRVRGAKGQPDSDQIDMASLTKDPQALGVVLMVVDRTIPLTVMSPVVKLHFTDEEDGTTKRIPESDREDGVVYTDQIGLEDKMFLFNWSVGGTGDAGRFRRETDANVAALGDGPSVPRDAVRPDRVKKKRR